MKNKVTFHSATIRVVLIFSLTLTLYSCQTKDVDQFFKGLANAVYDITSEKQLQKKYQDDHPKTAPAGLGFRRMQINVYLEPSFKAIKEETYGGYIRIIGQEIITQPQENMFITAACELVAGIKAVNSSGRLFESVVECIAGQCGAITEKSQKAFLDSWLKTREAEMRKQHPNLEGRTVFISDTGMILFARKK